MERNLQSKFGKWLKENPRGTAAYELKVTKSNSLPFSAVVEHQIQGLWHAKHKQIYHKIVDAYTQNPFDCFVLSKVPAFIIVKFPSKNIYGIDIDDFISESNFSKRKSLTEERAKEIASFLFTL